MSTQKIDNINAMLYITIQVFKSIFVIKSGFLEKKIYMFKIKQEEENRYCLWQRIL